MAEAVKINILLPLAIICILFLGLSCSAAKPSLTTPTTTSPTTTLPAMTTSPTTTTPPLRYAEWTFNDLTVTPSEAEVGEEVVVSVWVHIYGAIGEPLGRAILAIDGQVVATKDVWLTADFSELVSFILIAEEIGTHEVRLTVMLPEEGPYKIGENDLGTKFTVRPLTPPLTTPVSFEVEINADTFIPANITVPVGATVTWIHRDREADTAVWFHNVTSETGLFDSGLLAFGDTFSYTFTEPGTFNYYNKEFPYRHGTVIVE